jgi:hypothetical protein
MWFCAQIITKKEFGSIFGPASMHALGHIAANLSFAAVAISLTHTVKTLEPAFNVVLMKLLLGEATPLPAVLSLIPIIVRTEWLSSISELVGLSSLGLCVIILSIIMTIVGPPCQVGVALASAGELSFNWMGFLTAMASNLTFGFRAVWSKM